MKSPGKQPPMLRRSQFEHCEERLAMTASPLAELAIDSFEADSLQTADMVGDLQTASAQTHNVFGVTYAQNTYGFTGAGQTVAVIDTGIAWDHTALGKGFGSDYRVVGGWDFAENDTNPYDDGPAGFHGTHVAGIIGSDHATYSGVAPGVDLVALRVFDDQGNGNLAWVEKALQWVHDNRNSFENPITTVNLSLGTNWNSNNTPAWATLENEFAQLEADGIFVAVAAGNSFANYGVAGLSYPAVSPYVVPVASVNDSGQMSGFSQRNDRVIAAPGESIVSTVPDYVGNFNFKTDDFLAATGTSMATPYLAGASTLVRQAMEFAGHQNITQDTIYDHFRATADKVYDSATGAYYHVLDLEAALAALMPADDYGSTLAAAHSLGTVTGNVTVDGAIARLDDADYFTFTAGHTGTLRITLDGDLADPDWLTNSLPGAVVNGNTVTVEVVAGQNYVLGVSSAEAITHYSLEFGYANIVASQPSSLFDQARQLDESLGLKAAPAGSYYNWGGAREKWMQSDSGDWFFIKPDGSLYKWDGGTGIAGSQQIAQLPTLFYQFNDLLYDAPAAGMTDAALAERLDQSMGLKLNRTYSTNWGGMAEKWIQTSSGSWLFITPEGNLYAWNGGTDCTNSQLIAQLDASYHQDASLLHDAAAPAAATGELAYQLDQQYNFNSNGQYLTNWAGQGERWIKDGGGNWYFLTTSGALYRWNGSSDLSTSTLVAQFDKTFHADPSKLTNATVTGRYLAEQVYQLDASLNLSSGVGAYDNWAGMNERWMKDAQGKWYYITPDGGLYKWSGNADCSGSTKVAQLDASYHATPSKLITAATCDAYLASRADAFRQSLKFQEIIAPANQSGQQQVKWLQSRSGEKYYINSSGNLYRWDGSDNLASSQFVAAFDSSYFTNLSKLTGTGGVATTAASTTTSSLSMAAGQASIGSSYTAAATSNASPHVARLAAALDSSLAAGQAMQRFAGIARYDATAVAALQQSFASRNDVALGAAIEDTFTAEEATPSIASHTLGDTSPELIAQAFAQDDDDPFDSWDHNEQETPDGELVALDALYGTSAD